MYGWTDRFRMSCGSTILRAGAAPGRCSSATRRMQKQHEIYGELLAALNLYVSEHGTDGLCPSLREDLPRFVHRLPGLRSKPGRSRTRGSGSSAGSRAISCIPRRCAGSPSTGPTCWPRASASIALALGGRARCNPRGMHGARMERPRRGADHGVRAEAASTCRRCGSRSWAWWRPTIPDDGDPRSVGPCARRGDLYWRYRVRRRLPGDEGAFAACSFWVVGPAHASGASLAPPGRCWTGCWPARTRWALRRGVRRRVRRADRQLPPRASPTMAVIHEAVRLHEAETKVAAAG